MSAYINTKTSEYPFYEGDIRLLYPEMGENFILPAEFAVVLDSPLPDLTETEIFEESTPKLNNNGTYEKVYTVRQLTAEEIKIKEDIANSYLIHNIPDINPISAPAPEL